MRSLHSPLRTQDSGLHTHHSGKSWKSASGDANLRVWVPKKGWAKTQGPGPGEVGKMLCFARPGSQGGTTPEIPGRRRRAKVGG